MLEALLHVEGCQVQVAGTPTPPPPNEFTRLYVPPPPPPPPDNLCSYFDGGVLIALVLGGWG
jgi:hypothetical protein